MSARIQRVKVPNFTKSALDIADLCAKELWRGIDYETGNKKTVKDETNNKQSLADMGDEQIIKIFATEFYKLTTSPKHRISLSKPIIDNFAKATKINVATRRQSNLDYTKGIDTIGNIILPKYKNWNLRNTETLHSSIGYDFTEELSKGFFKPSPKLQDGNHLALASRILFYLIPNLPLFNYSPQIANGMKLNGTAQEILADYITELQNGYERNWHLLSQYQMPYPTSLNEDIWMKARNSGWWQRRIYDLALKYYFTVDKKGKRGFPLNNTIIELLLTSPHTH